MKEKDFSLNELFQVVKRGNKFNFYPGGGDYKSVEMDADKAVFLLNGVINWIVLMRDESGICMLNALTSVDAAIQDEKLRRRKNDTK